MGVYVNDNGTAKRSDGAASAASGVPFNDSQTGLAADNVQGAIHNVGSSISGLDTVELTATAAHAHAVGSTFLFIGQLVKTTVAISAGDTIAIGTNVTETSILNLIDQANTDISTLNSNLSDLNPTKTVQTFFSTWSEYPSYGYWRTLIFIPNKFLDVSINRVMYMDNTGQITYDVTASSTIVQTDSDYSVDIICNDANVAGKTAVVDLNTVKSQLSN